MSFLGYAVLLSLNDKIVREELACVRVDDERSDFVVQFTVRVAQVVQDLPEHAGTIVGRG